MSNASLKEQLLTLGLSNVVTERPPSFKKKLHSERPEKPAKKQKPAWLEQAQYGVELLKAHFPACFKEPKEIQPLKIGIKQELVKHLSSREDIVMSDKACMVNSLAYYVNSPSYHKQVSAGITRIDLSGQSAGVVTAEEAKYSLECRESKLKKKSNKNTEKAKETTKS